MSKIETAAEAGRALIAEHLIQGGPGDADTLELAATLCATAPAMVEALRRILQWIDAGCDPSRKSLENARAILSRIEGAGPPLSAYAETVTDAEYREIANGRASWPLKGASGDGAGDTLPDAPVPAPTGDAWAALDAARGYASNPEQWNPPSPEQLAAPRSIA